MAQTGYTPIALYYSTTASAAPAAGNLTNGELAINITDKKLYAKDNLGNVFVIADASSGSTTATNLAGGAAGSVPYQTGANATTFLSLGTAAQVLQVNAGATAPEWVSSTGTGNVVRASSPTLTTPTLGVASATSINKVTITAPATGSTLTIADGKTLTASNTLTFTGTDSSSVAFGTGGTVAYTSNNLSVFAATTSAQLAGVISDETGSGSLVFGTSPTLATPTITTSATVPLLIGGTGTTSTLTLRSTSGVGTTGADIIFQTGNNGATEAMRILNSGNVGIGTASPTRKLNISGAGAFGDAAAPAIRLDNTSTSRSAIIDYDNSQNLNIWNSQNSGTGAINFYSSTGSGTLHMTIGGTGNVGINTASPAGKLDVVGASYIGADSNNSCYVASTSSLVTIAAAGRTSFSTSALRLSTSDGSAVLERMRIDSAGNVGIGTASPGYKLDVAGTFNVTGNVTLGDAVSDTVTVSGYMGIGTVSTANLLRLTGSGSFAGSTQTAIAVAPTGTSAGTTALNGMTVALTTAAAAYTVTAAHGFRASDATLGASSAITSLIGFRADDLTAGINNYGVYSELSSGSNKYNIYSIGTASNYFKAKVLLNSLLTTGSAGWGTGELKTEGDTFHGLSAVTHNATDGNTSFIQMLRSLGTGASPTAVGSSTWLGVINWSGYDGVNANYRTAAEIRCYVNGTVSSGVVPGAIAFWTANTSGTNTERMRIDSAGNVGIGTASPAVKLDVAGALSVTGQIKSTVKGTTAIIDDSAIGTDEGRFMHLGATGTDAYIGTASSTGGSLVTGSAAYALEFRNDKGFAWGIGSTLKMALTSTGLGVGTASPGTLFEVAGATRITAGGATSIRIGADNNATTVTDATTKFGQLSFPHYNTAQNPCALIAGVATSGNNTVELGGNSGALNSATVITFYTAATTTTGIGTKRLQIDASGNVLVTSSGGLGYGTGSGGAVTQATSRTTGVTLDKTNGAITLVSAAGTTTWQTFTVTNSTVAATDTIIVNQKSGTDLYQIFVTNVAAGSFKITFATTGGTTTEQPVFNFAVIKAVAA